MKTLYVEDQTGIRNAISELLKLNGFNVTAVATGEDFIKEYSREDYELLLVDINLPNMSGVEVIEIVREHDKEIPIAVFTIRTEKNLLRILDKYNCFIMLKQNESRIAESLKSFIADPSLRKKINIDEEESLTEREKEYADYLTEGFINKEITNKMDIAEGTGRIHWENIKRKLKIKNPMQLYRRLNKCA